MLRIHDKSDNYFMTSTCTYTLQWNTGCPLSTVKCTHPLQLLTNQSNTFPINLLKRHTIHTHTQYTQYTHTIHTHTHTIHTHTHTQYTHYTSYQSIEVLSWQYCHYRAYLSQHVFVQGHMTGGVASNNHTHNMYGYTKLNMTCIYYQTTPI